MISPSVTVETIIAKKTFSIAQLRPLLALYSVRGLLSAADKKGKNLNEEPFWTTKKETKRSDERGTTGIASDPGILVLTIRQKEEPLNTPGRFYPELPPLC